MVSIVVLGVGGRQGYAAGSWATTAATAYHAQGDDLKTALTAEFDQLSPGYAMLANSGLQQRRLYERLCCG